MVTAKDVIQKLGLQPLPEEGGYYKETYRSVGEISPQVFGFDGGSKPRVISTAIYYLVVPQSFSSLHRIKSDEVFHFYGGDPVDMIQVNEEGQIARITIGSDIFNGQTPQVVVPAGVWQALRLRAGGKWALMGTTVAPGFEFQDFELGDREKLTQDFPQLRDDIVKFSREPNEKAH